MSQPVLEARGLSKSYRGVAALRGVDITVMSGSVHGICGPNGAGKSTLVRLLAGADTPDAGEATSSGSVVLVPQEITVVPALTVAENITLGSEPARWGWIQGASTDDRARSALAALELDVPLDALVGTLAPWQQRLVMIARAFDGNPSAVILDEPTAGLPPEEADLVTRAARRLVTQGVGVIYVSHHLSEVARICDEVTCIREGRNGGHLAGDAIDKDSLVRLIHDAAPEAGDRSAGAVGDVVMAIDGVSAGRLTAATLELRTGEVVGVAGLLGSGAKELTAVLAGAIRPEGGRVLVDDKPVDFRSPADALDAGLVYLAGDRGRSALAMRSIRDNVALSALRSWARLGWVRGRAESAAVATQLRAVDVMAAPHRPLGELSGGQQQRALMARCMITAPPVAILEEPTIGVDVAARQALWNLIRELSETTAVVVGSNDPEELIAVSDRVVCVKDGRIVDVVDGERLDQTAITSAIA